MHIFRIVTVKINVTTTCFQGQNDHRLIKSGSFEFQVYQMQLLLFATPTHPK